MCPSDDQTGSIRNQEMIPTKDLLKAQRKREYEQVKLARKQERKQAKAQAASEREAQRLAKDAAILAALKKGSDLEP